MLKNLSPILTGALLHELDSMEHGQILALLGSDYPITNDDATVIELGQVTMEAAADAVLSVMRLDVDAGSPICASLDETDEDEADVAFAINGIACDAELRRVSMSVPNDEEFATLTRDAAVVIRAGSAGKPGSGGRRCAFLLRKG